MSKKPERIDIRLSVAQKKQLQERAKLNQKTLSEYMLDSALALTLDTAKSNFYQGITVDMTEMKKQLYVVSRLLLLIGSSERLNEDAIIDFFHATEAKAEKIFDRE